MHEIDFHQYRIPKHIPVMVTLHLPPSWYPDQIWNLSPNYRLQCVSETQRLARPPETRERLSVIQNGIPTLTAPKSISKRKYALMLSRICTEKNLDAGLDAAREAGIPVVLGGEASPYEEHLRYLREQIEPRLGSGPCWQGSAAYWPGRISGARKTRLLAAARCLLIPTLAPETSSLVALEAIAAGRPIIAFRSGAIPVIVTHGRTGFLVNMSQR